MPAKQTIDFHYDASNALVIARPHWNIASHRDCSVWYQQYERYFKELGRGRVDVIFVLDDFSIEPGVSSVWGKYRADLVKAFTRHSVRVNASRRVSTASLTSGVLYAAASDEAPDMPSALAKLNMLRARERASVPPVLPSERPSAS